MTFVVIGTLRVNLVYFSARRSYISNDRFIKFQD